LLAKLRIFLSHGEASCAKEPETFLGSNRVRPMSIPNSIKITPELVASHGLKPDEYQRILDLIGREPSFTELGIFSAMWNEHCSYKSSKKWLKTLPTTGPRVIQGPGENAGVVDIDDGDCVVFKMESHNHPSYIEPYQGAATGVGGILRDVFTMGARPIAAMNALRFGAPAQWGTPGFRFTPLPSFPKIFRSPEYKVASIDQRFAKINIKSWVPCLYQIKMRAATG